MQLIALDGRYGGLRSVQHSPSLQTLSYRCLQMPRNILGDTKDDNKKTIFSSDSVVGLLIVKYFKYFNTL